MAIVNVAALLDANGGNTAFAAGSSFKFGSEDKVTLAADAAEIVSPSGKAKVTFRADGKYDFVDTSAAGGSYVLNESTMYMGSLTATQETGGIDFDTPSSLDTLRTGAGNDTIKFNSNGTADVGAGNDYVNVCGYATVTLGAGADTVELSGCGAKVLDYNCAEGDVIKTGNAISWGGIGQLNVAGYPADTVTVASASNVYEAKVFDGILTKVYAQAVGSSASYTAGRDAVDFDATGVTSSVAFASGSANDTVQIAAGQAVTYTLTQQSATDTLTGRALGASDKLVLGSGGDMSSLKLTSADIIYKDAATVQGAIGAGAGSLVVNFGGGDAKMMYSDSSGTGLTYAADAAYYIGRGASAVLDATAATDAVTIDMKNNVGNFSNVRGITAGAKGGSFIGSAKEATLITTTTGNGSSSFIWGGSADADAIVLAGAAGGKDTIFWGSKAADGADVVAGFVTTDDDLYLYETAAITEGLFKTAAGKVTVGGALDVAVSGGDVVKVMLKDGTVKKVALGDLTTAGVANAEFDTDIIMGGAGETIAVFADGDASLKQVILNDKSKYMGKLNHASLAAVNSEAILIGAADAASTLTGAKGKTAVWGGSKNDDTINLVSTDTDFVWFAAGDGKDTVNNFNADKDVVFVYNGIDSSRADSTVKLDRTTGNVVFGFTPNDTLTLNAVAAGSDTVRVGYQGIVNGGVQDYSFALAAENAAGPGDHLVFDAGTKMYIGNSTAAANKIREVEIQNDLDECKVISLLNNGDYYFKNIDVLDGRKAVSDLILMGADNGDVLYGGKQANAMWGGGADAQTMVGMASAKDYFWFGSGDGHDTARDVSADDMIVFWNVADISTVEIKNIDAVAGSANIIIGGGATLDMSTAGGAKAADVIYDNLTFMLGSGAMYSYKKDAGWVAKA